MKNQIRINNKLNSFKKKIEVNSDKSLSIRCVLLASLAVGISKLYNLLNSEDVNFSLKAIKKLGINFKKQNNCTKIYGLGLKGFNLDKKLIINAGNSGTLARLILGMLLNSKKKMKIIGDKSLSRRDFARVTEPLKMFGASIESNKGKLPVEVIGTEFLRPIKYIEKRGSAQCKTSVMLGALNTPGVTTIKAEKSRNHSEILFKNLKIPIKIKKRLRHDLIKIKGLTEFKSFNYKIPGDISSSSFFIVLTLLAKNSELLIKDVNTNPTRIGIIKILNLMNCNIIFKNKRLYKGELVSDIFVRSSNNLKAINCPSYLNSFAIDEFLVIFLVAAKAQGISTFKHLSELNKKESPRLDLAVKFLRMIGIKVERIKDNIKIYGNPTLNLKGNFKVKNYLKDHRIFMMSCISALSFGGYWTINDKDSINTSFPDFLKILKKIGAKIN